MNAIVIYDFYNYLFGEDLAEIALSNQQISENNINNYFNEMAPTMSEEELEAIKYHFGFNTKINKCDGYLLASGLRKLKHPSRSRYGFPLLLIDLVELTNESSNITKETGVYDVFSIRIGNVLKRNNINTVGDLINADMNYVKGLKNLGNTAAKEIELFLKFNSNIN